MIDARKLNKTINELEGEVENLKSVNELYEKISKTQESFEKANKDINDSSKMLKKNIKDNQEFLNQFIDDNKKHNNEFIDKVHIMNSQYKEQLLGLEKVQAAQLERNKSDIEVEIRNNSTALQKSLGNYIDGKFIELEKNITEKFREYDNKLNYNKKLNIVTLIVVILVFIINILLYFK